MVSSRFLCTRTGAAAGLAVFAMALCLPVRAQGVTVTIGGNAVSLNPGPVERQGRVFVPLRGVFERLGASVVYQSGTITATGSAGQTISLRIGSTAATVSGQQQTLDVAPFIIGASTYVPLRFIAQALGATVNYESSNNTVAIIPASGHPAAPPSAMPAGSPVRLRGTLPANGAYVSSEKPTISADFTRRVDPNTLKIVLDGLDVTAASTRSETGIVYAPPSPLQASQHTVRVSGRDASGASFDRSWSFTSGSKGPANTITLAAPQDGATVPSSFTVRGRTLPNSRVHILAGAVANVGGAFTLATGNYVGDTIADGNGNFAQQVVLNTVSGGSIGLTVTSTDPVTKESAQVRLRLTAS